MRTKARPTTRSSSMGPKTGNRASPHGCLPSRRPFLRERASEGRFSVSFPARGRALQRPAVDEHMAVLARDRLARERDHAFDQVLDLRDGSSGGRSNTTMSPAVDVVHLVAELVDEHAVADAQRGLHRPRRDVERLQQERLDDQRHEQGAEDHAQPLEDRLRVDRVRDVSSGEGGVSAEGGRSDSITGIRRVAGWDAVRATR